MKHTYTITQCYKDVEQILKRPLNSNEFKTIQSWFENYPDEHIGTCIKLRENSNVYNANYFTTIISANYEYYKILMYFRDETRELTEEKQKEKKYGIHL